MMIKQNAEDKNNGNLSKSESSENRELFKRALAEAIEMKIRKEEEGIELTASTSRRHKVRMNRLFRERVGGSQLPFPEVDNFFERIRSKLIIKFKINELRDKRKERRRAK